MPLSQTARCAIITDSIRAQARLLDKVAYNASGSRSSKAHRHKLLLDIFRPLACCIFISSRIDKFLTRSLEIALHSFTQSTHKMSHTIGQREHLIYNFTNGSQEEVPEFLHNRILLTKNTLDNRRQTFGNFSNTLSNISYSLFELFLAFFRKDFFKQLRKLLKDKRNAFLKLFNKTTQRIILIRKPFPERFQSIAALASLKITKEVLQHDEGSADGHHHQAKRPCHDGSTDNGKYSY